MAAKFFALLTNQGAAKLSNMAALGEKLEITSLAVGDGGGISPTPNQAQTKLVNEVRRAQLNSLSVDEKNDSQIIAEQIIPESVGGWWIREIGLFDADGILIAVANCPETYKATTEEGSGRTQVIRMMLTVSSTDAVTLKVDPSVVLATRQYVDSAVIEVKTYTDNAMKKHVDAANPHSQYLLIENALKELAEAGLVGDVLKNLHLEETVSRAANAMQINMDGKDIRDPATFRKSLNLGDSATRNTGSGLAEVVTGSILNFVIASLELKSASRAEVGTGDSNVPNNTIVASAISAALTTYLPKRAFTDKDFIRIPDVPGGLIIQWGRSAVQIPANSSGSITLPTPFPNSGLFALAFYSGDSGLQSTFNALVGSGSVKVFNTHPTNAATPSVLVFGY